MENSIQAGAVSLKVLAERKIEGVQKTTQFKADPRLIEVEEGFNARPINLEHVASIKAAYKSGASLPALAVRVENGRIILIDGHHRLTALLELIAEGEAFLAVDIFQFRGNDADRVAHMLTSAQGLPLTPLEQGLGYRRLLAFGWSATQIQAQTGKSLTHINSCTLLAESNTDVQQMVVAKEVSATVAVDMVRRHGSAAGSVLSGHLNDARMQGKSKVTNKTVTGSTPKDLIEAIEADMRSGGSFPAESLCPKYAPLITYLRNPANVKSAIK